MNKLNKFLGLVAMGGAFTGAAHAADVSVTNVVRRAYPVVGMNPPVGLLTATIQSTPVGISVTLPIPNGKTSADIAMVEAEVRTSSGAGPKPVTVTVSGNTLIVSGSNMTSGTLASGDKLQAKVYYKQ
jgi:hypothetical protein